MFCPNFLKYPKEKERNIITNEAFSYYQVRRNNEKRYGVLLTCLNTREFHIDFANYLSAGCVLMAIRRFITRKEKPLELQNVYLGSRAKQN